MRLRSSLPIVAILSLVACSSSSSSKSTTPDPTSDVVALSYVTNLIPASVTVGGKTGWAIVDTGNPIVLLDPSTFPSIAGLVSGGNLPSMLVSSQIVANVFVLATDDGLTSPDPAFPLAANVGCSAICGFVATFNYRDVNFGLGTSAPAPPANLGAETVFDSLSRGAATSTA